MLKINKKVEYALMALKFISQKDEGTLTSAREVCDTFNTPFNTTAKVMQAMNNHNILNSVKGIKGGYTLNRPLTEITYKELSEIIEGNQKQNICETSNGGLCDLHASCNIISPVSRLNYIVNEYLAHLTLDELLSPLPGAGAPLVQVEAQEKNTQID